MKINVHSQDLKQGLSKVQKALQSGKAIESYKNAILIQTLASENKILLTATDGIIRIATKVAAEIFEDGELFIGNNLFSTLTGKIEGNIEIEETSVQEIKIKAKGVSSTLKTLNVKDFPKEKIDTNFDNTFSISQKALKKAIKECLISVAKEEGRPTLKGILIKNLTNGKADFVSCDGFRLSICNINIEKKIINSR